MIKCNIKLFDNVEMQIVIHSFVILSQQINQFLIYIYI